MRFLISIAAILFMGMTSPQKLYFAVEVLKEGQVVARPKLLGEAGRRLVAERRAPGAQTSDYQLSLMPVFNGDHYRIALDLRLPDREGHSDLALLHGEERRLELGRKPGDLSVRLLVMEVDSPEFRALMGAPDEKVAPAEPEAPGIGGAGAI
jgi:hypothetical protein